jgi:hypothetical protein
MEILMNDEHMNKIIDKHMLNFLDEFEEAYDRAPTKLEHQLWMMGFIDGCVAIGEGISGNE